MDASSDRNTDYIDATDYTKLVSKINNLKDVTFDLTSKILATRKLRYAEIDLVAERQAGKIAPDEVYVPTHIIDTNIRREQSSYIQFVSQSPRAVILKDKLDPAYDLSLLEVDLTEKLRFDGWQLSMYSNIDGFQSNGYGIMETVQDLLAPGGIKREYVQYGDFAFIADTKDLQKCEMLGRSYYMTKTKLKELMGLSGEDKWNKEQVQKMMSVEPNDEQSQVYSGTTTINRSLYKVMKVMFRVKGIVQVGWACPVLCDDWLRAPRPLFLGRRKLHEGANSAAQMISSVTPQMQQATIAQVRMQDPTITDRHVNQIKSGIPASDKEYETMYPYFLYPYLVSENDTISNLKGRTFLDQDTQNAASSLLSSFLTKARRSSYLMFGKDTTDPNDDFMMQKNIVAKAGAIINGKVKEFELSAPDPMLLNALNTLISMNQQETSQVNFAETNRQNDSRKTATAIKASMQQQQLLSGTQVTLFSIALRNQFTYECEIIKSRVLAGLIVVQDNVKEMYSRSWMVKPSGDVDVIEKGQTIQAMQQAWPIIAQTPAAELFLTDLLEKMFPETAAKYVAAFRDAKAQQASGQQQAFQQAKGVAMNAGQELINMSKHPEFFSETGRVHLYPKVQAAAQQAEQLMNQAQGN